MKSIPLTRARHAGNFVVALEQHGMPVERYLSRTHLPVNLMEHKGGDGIISAVSMLEFSEVAAQDSGILDLGFHAGTVPISGYGAFGVRVARAPTLYSSIQTFCNEVRDECTEADYYLTQDVSTAWFCHGPVGSPPLLQHELYALMIMTQVIQLALGEDWHPDQVRLQSHDESCLTHSDFLLNTNIEFGAPITAIELPLQGLAAQLNPITLNAGDNTGADHIAPRLSADPLDALQEIITLAIQQSRNPTIERVAVTTGISKRTLQRFLGSKATTYSKLVDQVRYNMAVPLLADPSNSITEIACDLGYANVAHFSRAFKRITGLSPRNYRYMLKQ